MKRLLYISLAAMMVLAVSCKKDDNLPPLNTFVFDGVSKSIVKAYIDQVDISHNHYDLFFVLDEGLEEDSEEGLTIQFDGAAHLGKTIDLTKSREKDAEGWYWLINYYKGDFALTGDGSDYEGHPCQGGTLYTRRLEDIDVSPVLEIQLKGCKINGHSLSLNFKDKLTLHSY